MKIKLAIFVLFLSMFYLVPRTEIIKSVDNITHNRYYNKKPHYLPVKYREFLSVELLSIDILEDSCSAVNKRLISSSCLKDKSKLGVSTVKLSGVIHNVVCHTLRSNFCQIEILNTRTVRITTFNYVGVLVNENYTLEIVFKKPEV